MPAAIPIAVAVMAAGTIYQGVEHNQEVQHAKGSAEAETTAMNAEMKQSDKLFTDSQKQSQDAAAASAAAASRQAQAGSAATERRRAVASGSSTGQSTILTSPIGAEAAPTATKTLLGA